MHTTMRARHLERGIDTHADGAEQVARAGRDDGTMYRRLRIGRLEQEPRCAPSIILHVARIKTSAAPLEILIFLAAVCVNWNTLKYELWGTENGHGYGCRPAYLPFSVSHVVHELQGTAREEIYEQLWLNPVLITIRIVCFANATPALPLRPPS